MKGKVLSNLLAVALILIFIGSTASAPAQNTPADNMEIVKEKVRADKKLFIATNMELTEAEANAFWPVYEAYQAKLGKLKDRDSNLIDEFAANFGTMSDDAAKKLLDDSLSLESAYLNLRQSYLAKFRDVLPETKVARYYQLENKIEAVLRYEQAKRIPLIQ